MSTEEFATGYCPQCGEQLKVPAKLAQFSCMYCGARLALEDLRRSASPCAMAPEEAERALQHACAQLPECVRTFRGYQKKVTKTEFELAFSEVYEAAEPIFREMDAAFSSLGGAQGKRLQNMVCEFIDSLEEDWAKKRNANGARDDDKMVIAVFLVPAARKMGFGLSEPFCEALQKEWVRRYPKSPFYLGDYEALSNGFRKKAFGLCFITTAVCEELGKPDDCEELTAFRAFRDGYLKSCPDGAALIEEYYDIAPGIVSCIDLTTDRHETYRAIRESYLAPCYEDLQNGRFEACKARYTEMVRTLERRFLA